MTQKKVIALLVMVLIVTLPIVSAQPVFSSDSGFDNRPSSNIVGGTYDYFSNRDSSYVPGFLPGEISISAGTAVDRVGGAFSRTIGKPQEVGEALVVYAGTPQPSFIRASTLEQKDMTVYFPLRATDIGSLLSPLTGDPSQRDPLSGLTNLPSIQRMEVKLNKTNPFVRTVKYLPPQTFSKDNLGVVVVVLSKLRNGSALPSVRGERIGINTSVLNVSLPVDLVPGLAEDTPVITLDLNSVIQFDLDSNGLLNLAEQDLNLKLEDESNFFQKQNKNENAFLSQRGYVRVAAMSDERVTIAVYNAESLPLSIVEPVNAPAGRQVRTVQLSLSNPVSQPFNVLAGRFTPDILSTGADGTVFFRLNQIVGPSDRAEYSLSVAGKTYERKANVNALVYPRSRWKIAEVTQKERAVNSAAEVSRLGFEVDKNSWAHIKETNAKGLKITTHTMVLTNVATGEKKVVVREVLGSGNLQFDVTAVDDSTAEFLETKYCPDNSPDYACNAVVQFKKVIREHSGTKEAKDASEFLFHIFEKRLIDYASCDVTNEASTDVVNEEQCREFGSDMKTLALYYATKLKSTHPELFDNFRRGIAAKGGSVFLSDEGVNLELKSTEKIDPAERGKVSLTINGEKRETPLSVGDHFLIPKEPNEDEFAFVILEVKPNSIVVQKRKIVNGVPESKSNAVPMTIVKGVNNVEYERVNDRQRKTMQVEVREIEINREVSITVIPGTGSAISRSGFRVLIPIEPRPFKNLGETLEDHINATRSLVKELDKVIEKLDAVVRTWKKVCLVTFAFITLKSSFLGGSARSLARRGVTEIHKEKCVAVSGKGNQFKSVDECLASRSELITKDVDANQNAIESVNSKLSGKTPGNLENCGDVPFQQVKALGGTIEQCREYLRLKELEKQKSSLSPDLQSEVKTGLNGLGFEQKAEVYKDAKAYYELNKAKYEQYGENAELRAVQDYTNSLEEQKKAQAPLKNTVLVNTLNLHKDHTATMIQHTLVDGKSGGAENVELVQVSKLQRKIYEAGDSSAVVNDLKGDRCKKYVQDSADQKRCVQGYLRDWSKEYTDNTYVESKFLIEPETIQGQVDPLLRDYNVDHPAEKIKVLGANSDYITVTKVPSDFKFVSSNVKEVAGQLRSNDYAYVQGNGQTTGGLIAQYDSTGKAWCYPTGSNGEYILLLDRYTGGLAHAKTIRVMNVGANGVIECGKPDDVIVHDESYLDRPENSRLKATYQQIIDSAGPCKKEEDTVGHVFKGTVKIEVKCSMQQSQLNLNLASPKCIDVMEPSDCKLLFNVCDPVMCPASRCNFGGKYQVKDVIQSGLVGSTILCAPNIKQGVVVPVCLTGILAGLKNIRSILQSYSDCLEISLKEGRNVGFCDYVNSVGICELVWREAASLLQIKGAVVDYLGDQVFGEPEGGAEYLTFQESVNNVGESFRYFTTEYSNTYVAALKGSSTGEVGSQLCRLGVYGRFPSVGEVLDRLSEPEDPPQFFALFDEAPYVQDIGVSPLVAGVNPSTQQLSTYKVFYHIYAGTGFAQQAVFTEPLSPGTNQPGTNVNFAVILRNREAGLRDIYVTNEGDNALPSATVGRNQYAQKTVQTVAPSGYSEICIILNGKQECGFGKVTSALSLNMLNDELVEDEALKKIDSAEKCVPNNPNAGASLGSLATPEKYGLLSTGVVRVCNPTEPTPDAGRWKPVGSCGKDKNQIDRGTCWLDQRSVRIMDVEQRSAVFKELKLRNQLPDQSEFKVLDGEKSAAKLNELNAKQKSIITQLRAIVENLLVNKPGIPASQAPTAKLDGPAESPNTFVGPPIPSANGPEGFFGYFVPTGAVTILETPEGDVARSLPPGETYNVVEIKEVNNVVWVRIKFDQTPSGTGWVKESDGKSNAKVFEGVTVLGVFKLNKNQDKGDIKSGAYYPITDESPAQVQIRVSSGTYHWIDRAEGVVSGVPV